MCGNRDVMFCAVGLGRSYYKLMKKFFTYFLPILAAYTGLNMRTHQIIGTVTMCVQLLFLVAKNSILHKAKYRDIHYVIEKLIQV